MHNIFPFYFPFLFPFHFPFFFSFLFPSPFLISSRSLFFLTSILFLSLPMWWRWGGARQSEEAHAGRLEAGRSGMRRPSRHVVGGAAHGGRWCDAAEAERWAGGMTRGGRGGMGGRQHHKAARPTPVVAVGSTMDPVGLEAKVRSHSLILG
jgi:hypothetical protein